MRAQADIAHSEMYNKACGADVARDIADLEAQIHVNSSESHKLTADLILSEGLYPRHIHRRRYRLAAATAGRMFSVDFAATLRWPRFNLGAVVNPRFAKALIQAAQAAGRS